MVASGMIEVEVRVDHPAHLIEGVAGLAHTGGDEVAVFGVHREGASDPFADVPREVTEAPLVHAGVPQHHGTAAVLSCRNDSFKTAIGHRMILHLYPQAFDGRIEARTFGHCPTLQHAIQFQSEVVMQPTGGMFLNNESRGAFDLFGNGFACRLSRFLEVAFAFVFGQRHSTQINHGLPEWAPGL